MAHCTYGSKDYLKPNKTERQCTKQSLVFILYWRHLHLTSATATISHKRKQELKIPPLGLCNPRLWLPSLIPAMTTDSQAFLHVPSTTHSPPKGTTPPLRSALPLPALTSLHCRCIWSITCQWHHTAIFRSHSLPWHKVLMSQSGWTQGLGWTGEKDSHQKLRDASSQPHWPLSVHGSGALETSEVFCVSQLLVTRTHLTQV